MSLRCPYCDTEIDDPDDCYDEALTYEHECPACEKNFIFGVEYSRDYSAHKADCLNGADHDYQKTATIPARFAVLRCSMCGDEKPI